MILKKILTVVLVCMLIFSTTTLTTFATEIYNELPQEGYNVPNVIPHQQNTYSEPESQQAYVTPNQSSSRETTQPTPDYAGDLFGDVKLDKDNSFAQPAIDVVQDVVGIVVGVIISILPSWVVLNTTIDLCCMLAPPVMWFFANLVPFQLFSNEITQITGVSFAGKNGGGGSAASDLGQQNKYIWYLKQRFINCLFAFLMIVLVSTGVYFDILNWIINAIVAAILSFLPA